MAKKQSFSDKVGKQGKNEKTTIKLVKTFKGEGKDNVRFNEEMVGIPEGENIEKFLKSYIDSNK
tara:strand:+ start:201 stop:392 length:192 start_codon:yes stop_codon:yes gene_type:complete